MIYIIKGQEEVFIRKKIEELSANKDAEIIRFDGSDKNFTIQEMLEACSGNSLFSNKSVVLVNQPYFLCKKCDDNELKQLTDYIDNPIYETDLVFYTYEDNFNSKLKAYKAVSENAQIIELNGYNYKDFNRYVKERINEEGLDIQNDAVELLTNICKRSATVLNQNIEVLKLYPEKINSDVVSKLCTQSDDNEAFELINALTNKNISKSISLFRKLMSQNDSIYSVLGLLANQLRYLYHISYLVSLGKKKKEIIDITGSNEYRLNKAMETLNTIKMNQIIELLAKLSDLDLKCKSDSSVQENTRFEMFILELLQKG